MHILVIHERYANRAGEDMAVDQDLQILKSSGHTVSTWLIDNTEIEDWSLPRRAALLWETAWSRRSYRTMGTLIDARKPDLVHFHNTLPIISPAPIWAAHRRGLPVVMTLHNYRLYCPVGTYFRGGSVCEDCRTHSLWRGIAHACYRGSRVQTAAVALMLKSHRMAGTWARCVDAFVAPSEFLRTMMAGAGLPAEKLSVRSNLVDHSVSSVDETSPYAVFAGRLSEEKGVRTLLEAARRGLPIPIKVLGRGPLEDAVRYEASRLGPRLQMLGHLDHRQAIEVIARARLLIHPSVCYETQGLALLEALAHGVPVVASRLGASMEVIEDGREGYFFDPGSASELAERVTKIAADPMLRERMSVAAKDRFAMKYAPDRSYSALMAIYRLAAESARGRARSLPA